MDTQSATLPHRTRPRVISTRTMLLIGVLVVVMLGSLVYQGLPSSGSNTGAWSAADRPTGLVGPGTQVNGEGEVSISVTWRDPTAGMSFEVSMDTHSVDLDPYDLSRLVVLRTDDGREALPLKWDAPKGGHHRKGTLTFSDTGLDRKPLIGPSTKGVVLTIYDVGGVQQRSFQWTF